MDSERAGCLRWRPRGARMSSIGSRLGAGDVLDIVEEAYATDRDPREWLRSVTEHVYRHLGAGIGVSAFFYRVNDAQRVEIDDPIVLDAPHIEPGMLRASLGMLPPEFVRKSFVRCECTTQSAAMDDAMRAEIGPMLDAMAAFGWRDVAMVGGLDPSGHGVYVGAWLPEETRLATRAHATWNRIAAHLATANRLRRATRGARAEAVLTPSGELEHAEGEASSRGARAALREAVRAIERARGPMRRDEPDGAVAAWRALTACRWSLVDQFESDGRRYVVAHRNEPRVGAVAALTERERQAVAFAALRHNNKLIA